MACSICEKPAQHMLVIFQRCIEIAIGHFECSVGERAVR